MLRHCIQRISRRSFHDCPINAIQPLRLLLIGSPVSFFLFLLFLFTNYHQGRWKGYTIIKTSKELWRSSFIKW
jgi:hypothetical protein